MRDVPDSMTNAWLATAKTGSHRPVIRATIQRQHLYRFQYDTAYQQGSDVTPVGDADTAREQHRAGYFSSFIFGEDTPYLEIPNIISFSWDRSVNQDVATATLTLLNTEVIPVGDVAEAADALDRAGFLTYNRGVQAEANTRWGQEVNGWNGILVPDMVIKTYEGYGTDPNVAPAKDPYLVQSGLWKVDTVALTDDGAISVAMRDIGSILLDTDTFPPVIPYPEWPLAWVKNQQAEQDARQCIGGHWQDHLNTIGSARSSNDLYIGGGFTNAPFSSYVNDNGAVEGHAPGHAIAVHDRDTDANKAKDEATFWRSTGQDEYRSMVWWEFDVDSGTVPVGALRIRPAGGPYRVYVSIHNGTRWVGKRLIPYQRNGISGSVGNLDIHAAIPFVTSMVADRFFAQDWTLPRVYNAKRIRLTFTRLRQKEVGEHPFRAGLRELQIYTAASAGALSFKMGKIMRLVGNYGDYTHIIKWTCAWAGWYWPPHSTGQDFIRVQDGPNASSPKDYVSFNEPDPVLPTGRVWGDFMKTGTAGLPGDDLKQELFVKKPLMDMIGYVRDVVGFLFFIDETGGVVWRAPNYGLGGKPKLGNYLSPAFFGDGRPGKRGRGGRTSEIVTLDDDTTLLDYSTTLDSKNVRERVFVANSLGKAGVVVKGFNPFPTGLLRVAGWTDQHFTKKGEARIMADLIVAQQMFSYKTGRATIPGYPKIQCDDMVRVYERVTSETFYHYVIGIHSELNMAEGAWTYDLDLHWLGEDPSDAWVIDVHDLHAETQQYLAALGFDPVDAQDNDDNATWVPGPGGGG